MAKAEIRMTEGPIAKQLVSFAIPLFLGFLFQQLYNTCLLYTSDAADE